MKNILVDLQLSSLSKERKFLIAPDSNVNVSYFMLKGLAQARPDWKFYLLVPSLEQLTETDSFKQFGFDEILNLTLVNYNYYPNAFIARHNLDVSSLDKALLGIDVDVVLTNDPTKVLSYKTFFYYRQNRFIPVISRNHWVTGPTDRKVPEEIDFQIAQVEGAIYGDAMTFNSKFAIELFYNDAAKIFREEVVENFFDKLHAFETVPIEKIDKYKTEHRLSKFTILWAHRLSSYTGWQRTLGALNQLWKKRQDWCAVVPDPGNKFTQEELKEKYPFIYPIDKSTWNHKEYMRTCWAADLVIGNHSYPATWGGLAITEPMAAYTAPLLLDAYCYREMFYNNEDCFFYGDYEMLQKIERFIDSPAFLEEVKKGARRFCETALSPKEYTRKYLELIDKSLKI